MYIISKRRKYATLKDVASLANASLASTSEVLSESGKRYVSPEMRERILNAASQLDYVKSTAASGLRGVSQNVIALLIPQFDNPFFTRLAISVERVAHENDYIIFVCDTKDSPTKEKDIIETVIGHRVDGILIAPTCNGSENTSLLRKYNIPYVVVDRPIDITGEYDFVVGDNYQAGAVAARKLLDHGHRRFGFVGWESGISSIDQRLIGFKDTISPYSDYFDFKLSDKLEPGSGYDCTKALFEHGSGITSVLYGHHWFAQGGLEFFRDAGILVPEHVSAIQIGVPDWAKVVNPTFTCVYQPITEMGEIATQMLIERISGKRSFHETRLLKHTLLEGGTIIDVPLLGVMKNVKKRG